MWAPLMWPKHWTRVAMAKPKQREMSTRSGGGAGGVLPNEAVALTGDPQAIVEPKLINTKRVMAKSSPKTARQKSCVHTPRNAAIIDSREHTQEGMHLLPTEWEEEKEDQWERQRWRDVTFLQHIQSYTHVEVKESGNIFEFSLNLCSSSFFILADERELWMAPKPNIEVVVPPMCRGHVIWFLAVMIGPYFNALR